MTTADSSAADSTDQQSSVQNSSIEVGEKNKDTIKLLTWLLSCEIADVNSDTGRMTTIAAKGAVIQPLHTR